MTNFDFIVNRWLVVSGSGHCEELMVSIVSGLQLTIASASTMKVLKDLSSSWVPWRSSMDANTFLTDLIWRSHTPPM